MCFAALGLVAASAFALPFHERTSSYFSTELKAVEAEYGPRVLAEVKVGDLIPVAGRLDVARQKDGYVLMAGGLSMVWPGAGQFAAGEWSTGAVHTGLHLGVTVASLAWAHSLLPADLRWGNLDYLDASESTIKTTWSNHHASEFFPAVGALALGGALDLALRIWSANDAQTTAKSRIDQGEITFEPRFHRGHWGFGMRF